MRQLFILAGVVVLGTGCFVLRTHVDDIEPTRPGFALNRTPLPSTAPTEELFVEPTLISEVMGPYPDAAKENGIEGTVFLKVRTDERGKVVHVEVLDGPGFGLNRAALESMWKFRFRPGYDREGTPLPFTFVYSYTFKLD